MDPVAIATWGLVVATALLVLASVIPVINGFQDRRRGREVLASQVIPTMHLLKGRLVGAKERMFAEGRDRYIQVKDFYDDDATDLQMMLQEVIQRAHEFGLKFTNEMFVARHLISQASISAAKACTAWDSEPSDRVSFDNFSRRAARLCVAAANTLTYAELDLPAASTRVDGEPFNDRFKRLGNEREEEAEKQLIELRYRENAK